MPVISDDRVKVSVLMPVFNAQDTLAECVDSIFRQYVRNHCARGYCRDYLDAAGYVMGLDYLDVA